MRILLDQEIPIKPSTIYKWAHYHYMPCVKIGNRIRFKEQKVEEWLKKRERKGRNAYKMSP
ncbi:MAG: helix-turn-helix domain-containing protein [Candidatus Omnitrophica bacterium]|nr:helix-turn-helix domain-containing protein [Candidatus Omnitrophota bacterium]MBU4589554.1 helix-turn-helix domain-containing protein [Candidatus Omnitrophota bacterium]